MNQSDFLWALYVSERDFIRHHENQRTNASSILAAISAGLLAVTGGDGVLSPADTPIFAAIAVVGAFGFVFSAKLYERIQLHANRSYSYLKLVDREFADQDVSEIKKLADAGQKKEFPIFSRVRLNIIWLYFHLFVFVAGATLAYFSFSATP